MHAVFEQGLKNHEREGGPRAFPELQVSVRSRCEATARRDAPAFSPQAKIGIILRRHSRG